MDQELRTMIMAFRVSELQTLLGYAGKNKTGRKNELQARALDLSKTKSSPIVAKIRELYKSIQNSTGSSQMANGMTYSQHQPRVFGNNSNHYATASDKVLQGLASPFVTNFNVPKPPMVSVPLCPDVKMKRLPFYDVLAELIKPTSLLPQVSGRVQESNFSFCLTPQQAASIGESKNFVAGSLGDQKLQYTTQVQLRFCSLDTAAGLPEQDDQFPPHLVVKVNGKLVPLPHPIPSNRPGIEPKRPSRPLNITNFVRLSPTVTNAISVTWTSDSSRGYALSVYLVEKLASADLLGRLKQRGPRPAEYSRGLIKELIAKDDGDCMIAMTSLKVTIACPLGKCRMTLPCRATTCKHLQCFDANLFLQMNERKPTWICPVCDKPTRFEDLCIDEYFQEVISKMTGSENSDIELFPDGTWKMICVKSKEDSSPPAKKFKPEPPKANQTIDLDDDVLIEEDVPKPKAEPCVAGPSSSSGQGCSTSNNGIGKTNEPPIVDLTLSSDEEDDEPVRPRRRAARPNYAIEDDSSSAASSSTNASDDEDTVRQEQPAPAPPAVRSDSPACITLVDSRSPSPEPTTASHSARRAGGTQDSCTRTGGSTSSLASSAQSRPPASSSNNRGSVPVNFDFGHPIGQPSGFSRSTNAQSISPNMFPQAGGYLPFDTPNTMWGSNSGSGSFQNTFPAPDFSQLDFNSLDDYSYYSRPSNNPGAYRWT